MSKGNDAADIPVSFGGWAGTFFDGDGDQELELLLGGPAGQSMIFDSELVAHPTLTLPPEFEDLEIVSVHAFDADGDLDHELFVAGEGTLGIIDWADGTAEFTDLLDLVPAGSGECAPGGLLAADLDDDGDLDVHLGCVVRARGTFNLGQLGAANPPRLNFSLIQEDGEWTYDDSLSPLDQASTLAINHLDWDRDGDLDIVLLNDHPVGDGLENPFLTEVLGPAAVLAWTPEGYVRQPMWGNRDNNFGSWMGGAEVFLDSGRAFYATEIGFNLLLSLETAPASRLREPRHLLEFGSTSEGLDIEFGWGVVATDFDGDGRQDLYFSRGIVSPAVAPDLPLPPDALEAHTDFAWVVDESGEFVEVAQPHPSSQAEAGWSFQARGTLLADLGADGVPDLVVLGMFFHESDARWRAGAIRYRVESANHSRMPPRCSLIPVPWLVPSVVGYGIREARTDFFRVENSGGQLRAGGSPWPMSTHGAGTLRFASGAQVEFDCRGEPGPILVEEPADWLTVESRDSRVAVCIDQEVWGEPIADVRVWSADAATPLELDGECWTGAHPGGSFTLSVDGRHIAHRFQ